MNSGVAIPCDTPPSPLILIFLTCAHILPISRRRSTAVLQILVSLSLAAGTSAFAPGSVARLAAAKANPVVAATQRSRRNVAPSMAFSMGGASSRALASLTRRKVKLLRMFEIGSSCSIRAMNFQNI